MQTHPHEDADHDTPRVGPPRPPRPRARPLLAALAVATLVAAGALLADRVAGEEGSDPSPGTSARDRTARDTDPAAAPQTPDPAVFELDCGGSLRSMAIYDHFGIGPGEATPEQAVRAAKLLDSGETLVTEVVGPRRARAAVLRPDGSTRALLSLDAVEPGWLVGRSESCASGDDEATALR